ncbi:hypothetical protein [Oceanobacillus profundus]|uniref:DUF4183 domain-containing protein n=1 Tax=Oceanobacillus profundus TaxID=372463 RepID=A0A417YGP4_9BACI|nr:hypothetical protein [Oceanobacillus profundus]MBR2246173.1 hypothetical protein [Bacilli bacterium]MBR3119843.1 hypothetical protein [Oceanobacillus sp.]RHW31987.1 hypothetical protein D1B32_12175 [Oceanobacillus profundus]
MALVRPYPGFPQFRRKTGVMTDFSGSRFSDQEKPYGDQNGINRVFVLLHQPLSDSLQVFKDGMLMTKNVDYTLNIQEKRITFSEKQIPQEASVITVSYKHY